jgi:phosphoribosylaminoimidazolecarboxamide formyltransferase/IMP cyclohydrolase
MICPKRALISVSNKTGLDELGRALHQAGVHCVATGGSARALREAGVPVAEVQSLSQDPEAFGGRLKTLSYRVSGGILFRRHVAEDEKERLRLGIEPIDLVVVNFYPFESDPTIEKIDIGGPTLVRAAAKNAPHVLVATDPTQYPAIIAALKRGGWDEALAWSCAARAWERVSDYDAAIARVFGEQKSLKLRYGENPHQSASLRVNTDSPIDWLQPLTENALSYNNISDVSSGYDLLSELSQRNSDTHSAVIIKHGNPCGAVTGARTQLDAIRLAWEGDPVSAFGGVVLLSHPLSVQAREFLEPKFIELIAAPQCTRTILGEWPERRKNLKALRIDRFETPWKLFETTVVGGSLSQSADFGEKEIWRQVSGTLEPSMPAALLDFGVSVVRSLRSNAVAIVRETPEGLQLVGAGQGQPNRVDAIEKLAIPRALKVVDSLSQCVLVSDAFFPFADSIEVLAHAGIRRVAQPGGSVQDPQVIAQAQELGVQMWFSGKRHFRHG